MTSPTHEDPAEPRRRFCTQCGAELAEGARFCTECGVVIEGASPRERPATAEVPPAAGPVPPEPPAPTPGAPRRRRGVVVAAVLAALVLLAAGGAAVTRVMGLWGAGSDAPAGAAGPSGTDEPDVPVAAFGSRAAVGVSRVTRIVPQVAWDTPISHYVVRVREAADPDGRALDVTGLPQLDVRAADGEGFALGDLSDELAAGTYEITVTPDGEAPRYLPPLSVGEPDASGEAGAGEGATTTPDRLEVLPPSELDKTGELPSIDPIRKGKYAAFLAKLCDLEAEHGPATVVSGGASSFPDARWLDGLCFAKVMDFGDGVERLVVAYGAEGSLDESYPGDWYAYTVEVWEYSEGTDDLVNVWMGNMSFSNGGYASLSFSESQDGSARYYVVSVPDANNTVVGVRDDGSFGVVAYLEAAPGGPNGTVRYLVDGLEVSEDEYWATSDRYGIGLTTYGSGTSYSLAAYGSPDMGDPEATAQVAKDTRATLESLAGDLLDAEPDE